MERIKLAVIFGGMSTEHDVSIVSGMSVLKHLNKEKYEIYPIYIDKEGEWYHYTKPLPEIVVPEVGEEITHIQKIENIVEVLKQMNCVFPVLHGLYGEDGTIQGFLELLKIPYVGCRVLASSVSMDKAYTKILFDRAGIQQVEYVYLKKEKGQYYYVEKDFSEKPCNAEELIEKIEQKLTYPVFVKPSNSGSSVGITKVKQREELIEAIEEAAKYDRKILIEQGIEAREIECAVLGNEQVEAACVGEILSAEEFYSFDSKYKNEESVTVIPAKLPRQIAQTIRELAVKAFKAVDGAGLARVDFFVEKQTEQIYINEINTMPGFTNISMYPKLWEAVDMPYTELLDKLITLSMSH